MKNILIILLLFVFVSKSFEQCNCLSGIGASKGDKPFLTFSFPEINDTLILCGYVHEIQKSNNIIASEFEVIPCNLGEYILQFSALDVCRIEDSSTTLRITELKRLPFGKDWEWLDFDYKQFDVVYKENQYCFDTTFVFKCPIMNSNDLCKLKEFYMSDKDNYDSFEKLIYLILGAALNGDDYFKNLLFSIGDDLNLDGAFAEYNSEALKIYNEYISFK